MKLKEALISDVRKDGVWEQLHELLFKIPPLKKYEMLGKPPIEALEKMMRVFDEKYGVRLQYIMNVPQSKLTGGECFYLSCSLKDRQTNQWIGTVYGLSIYECYVKMVLLSYGHVKRQQK